MPQLWRATRNLLLCDMGSVHLLFAGVRLDVMVFDLCCRRLVNRFCIFAASTGAVASGFRASSAEACIGSRMLTTWSIASDRLEGGVSIEAVGMGDESPVLCPRGVVISLHKEVSAFLTQRVIVELALIITFPSVAAMAHLDA